MTGLLGPGVEFDLIRAALANSGEMPAEVRVGPGDDAAVVALSEDVVLSSDLTIEGIHFRADWLTPREVGYRAVAAALSDLAAMAARPVGVLMSVGVDADRASVWVTALAEGARDVLGHTGGALLGGDLSRTPRGTPVVIDIVAVGQSSTPVTRAGAQPGDEIWVTGVLGWPAFAVSEWMAERTPEPAPRQRFVHPKPRTNEARWLHDRATLSAMIDISDGLAADVGHLAAASGVRVTVVTEQLPVPTELVRARGLQEARVLAASGGEEYELCVVAAPGELAKLAVEFESTFDGPLTLIGEVTTGAGVDIVGVEVAELDSGHDHFRDR